MKKYLKILIILVICFLQQSVLGVKNNFNNVRGFGETRKSKCESLGNKYKIKQEQIFKIQENVDYENYENKEVFETLDSTGIGAKMKKLINDLPGTLNKLKKNKNINYLLEKDKNLLMSVSGLDKYTKEVDFSKSNNIYQNENMIADGVAWTFEYSIMGPLKFDILVKLGELYKKLFNMKIEDINSLEWEAAAKQYAVNKEIVIKSICVLFIKAFSNAGISVSLQLENEIEDAVRKFIENYQDYVEGKLQKKSSYRIEKFYSAIALKDFPVWAKSVGCGLAICFLGCVFLAIKEKK